MRKIFTFTAALLASVAMMAAYTPTDEEVIILYDVYSADAVDAGYSTHTAIAWAGTASTNDKKAGDPYNNGEATSSNVHCYSAKGNGGGKNITINISGCSSITVYHEKHSSRYVELRDGSKTGTIIAQGAANTFFTQVTLDASTEYTIFLHGTTGSDDQDLNVYAVKLVPGTIVPVTDPVASVVIDGPETIYVGKTASYTATTDVKANAYKWFVNGAEQEGATTAKFDFTPEAAGTFNISCSAKNDNNTDFVTSNVIALVASVKPVLPQVTVDASTTWDWTKAASVATIQWTAETEYKKGVDTVLLANVEGMNNDDEFNSQALFFKGEYPVRNNEYSQGSMWMFNTSVAGYIQVYFSNTGGKDTPRYVAVNGVVNTAVGTLNQNIVPSAVIAVAAGEVKIEGSFEDYNEGAGVQYIHVSKIVFSTEEIPTAINNTNAAVKAVKVVRNGQLFIEKNGVIYNAQGAIVK